MAAGVATAHVAQHGAPVRGRARRTDGTDEVRDAEQAARVRVARLHACAASGRSTVAMATFAASYGADASANAPRPAGTVPPEQPAEGGEAGEADGGGPAPAGLVVARAQRPARRLCA